MEDAADPTRRWRHRKSSSLFAGIRNPDFGRGSFFSHSGRLHFRNRQFFPGFMTQGRSDSHSPDVRTRGSLTRTAIK